MNETYNFLKNFNIETENETIYRFTIDYKNLYLNEKLNFENNIEIETFETLEQAKQKAKKYFDGLKFDGVIVWENTEEKITYIDIRISLIECDYTLTKYQEHLLKLIEKHYNDKNFTMELIDILINSIKAENQQKKEQ